VIIGLDHLVVLCPSLEQGARDYEVLLGRPADWRSTESAGMESALFQLGNMALELIAPHGESDGAKRLNERLAQNQAAIQSLVFASDDLTEDHRVLARRALQPEDIQDGQSRQGDQCRTWQRFRLTTQASAGMRMFVLQRGPNDPLQAQPAACGAVASMDHCVISTPNPDRAAALYGARLGLRFALDRTNEKRDLRLQWFRAGEATVEVAHRISQGVSQANDVPMGVTWKVGDIDVAHQRLLRAHVEVSEIRQGFKPGTRVFTVRSHTNKVPTLFLAG
jgi:catechol 2,3-dioxygenase-like lactoylglutathione lyase family enzyme